MCYLQNKFNVADFKAEKFSKLSHLLLSGQVIVERTVRKWHMGEPVLQEQLHALKTFYQSFIQNVVCKLNSEGELNS